MGEIYRGKGLTESERYLARLVDHTFLDLWAYPNVYRKPGKEMCDLLVVCGDHVLIFSVKDIAWRSDKPVDTEWPRWFNHAIKECLKELKGAERWIDKFPTQIYTDAACRQRLPFEVPTKDKRKTHRIIIALGAHKPCSDFFGGDIGSFMIRPQLKGEDHTDVKNPNFFPFTVGDIDPEGGFVHVMNEVTLDILMFELDTISDFTEYLDKKAQFFRSGHLINAGGEEDVLAYYLTHGTPQGHAFTNPKDAPWESNEKLALDTGTYAQYRRNPQYRRKKKADEKSYIWDELIKAFTSHLLAGTTITPNQEVLDFEKHGLAVRYMAHESRVERRMLGEGLWGVLEKANKQDRTMRAMLPSSERPRRGVGYVFMTLALPKKSLAGGYEQYRKVRSNMLITYCIALLRKSPHMKCIIGIAVEPPPIPGGPEGSSEDLVFVENPQKWTPEDEANLQADCEQYNILNPNQLSTSIYGVREYPDD